MRKAWLITNLAGFSAVGFAAAMLQANPAGMAMQRPVQSPTVSAAAPAATAATTSTQLPSAQISPYRNPVKYFVTSISEMPIGWKKKPSPTTNAVAPPATEDNNAVAQSTPTGPSSPQHFIAAAQLYERQGDIQQARGQYGQALTMWPGNVDVLREAARMEDRQGELAMAESLYRQAVAANPSHAGALNDLGLCLARQGKLDASVQVIEQAIQLQPEKALYRNNAATVLIEMRQDQRALGHLATVHSPADAHYNLGQLLVQRGRPADATPHFQAAVEQNPGLEPAHVALARLQGRDPAVATPSYTQPDTTQYPPQQMQQPLPQQSPPAGPQLYYPASGVSPYGASTNFAPPTYYAPPVPGATHRYLPPVAIQPGAPPRR